MNHQEKKEEIPLLSLDYEKYLKCPHCKEREYYCEKHKMEVEKFLESI